MKYFNIAYRSFKMTNLNNTIIKINIGKSDNPIIEYYNITTPIPESVVVFNNDNKKDLWKVD